MMVAMLEGEKQQLLEESAQMRSDLDQGKGKPANFLNVPSLVVFDSVVAQGF